jgi:hypothetical protein
MGRMIYSSLLSKVFFESKALHFDNYYCLAIDHRAEFVFDKAYDWNFTIIEAEAYAITEENPQFKESNIIFY